MGSACLCFVTTTRLQTAAPSSPATPQMTVALAVATLVQRCAFRPLPPAADPLIPVSFDITMNFERTGGLRMEVAPRG